MSAKSSSGAISKQSLAHRALRGAAQLDRQLAGARGEERVVRVARHQREAGDVGVVVDQPGGRSGVSNWHARCGAL